MNGREVERVITFFKDDKGKWMFSETITTLPPDGVPVIDLRPPSPRPVLIKKRLLDPLG